MNRWYRLDNVAKLFPSVTGTKNSSVFRVSAVLDEIIDKEKLQEAVSLLLERYPTMYVKLRKGLFWHYFENTSDELLVEEETQYPCAAIDSKIKGGYLIKVFYYKKRISIEIFHALADGNGGMEYLKSLVFYYLKLSGKNVDTEDKILTLGNGVWAHELEDSFNRYYKKTNEKYIKNKKAFRIRGENFEHKGTNVTTGIVELEKLSSFTKSKGITLTVYLIAVLAKSIYETNIKFSSSKKQLVIAVPVNLRNVFDSKTLKNFFGVINIIIDRENLDDFEKIVYEVKNQINVKTKKEFLQTVVADNLKVATSKYSRLVPLFLKNIFVRLGFFIFGEDRKTITLSNMGNFVLPKSMEEYIKHFEAILYPTAKSPINCSMCSYNSNLVLNFSRSIEEDEIIRYFFRELSEEGFDVKIYSNNWGKELKVPSQISYEVEEVEYPDYAEAYKTSKKISMVKIVLFITVCLGIIFALINIFTYEINSFPWSVVADISLVAIWLVLLLSLSKRIKTGGKILGCFWILAFWIFLIDIFTGFGKWSTTYVVPFMTIIVTFLITLIALARRRLYKEYMGYLLIALFTGICPILLFAFFLSNLLWTCISAVVYSLLTIIGLLIFSDKNFKKEIIKRFHY